MNDTSQILQAINSWTCDAQSAFERMENSIGDTKAELNTMGERVNQIQNLLKEGVIPRLKDHEKRLREHVCPIPKEALGEVGAVVSMIKHAGKGEISQGVKEISDNHGFLSRFRQRIDAMSAIAIGAIITTFFTGLGAIVWVGIKSL